MKIQINSLEALERLIGGDTQLEIDVRNSVVQAFCKRHLKSIANESMVQKIADSIRNKIQKDFFEMYKDGWRTSYKLNAKGGKVVKDFIEGEMEPALRSLASELIESAKLKEKVEGAVNNAVGQIMTKIEAAVLEKKIDRLADKRIKEKLGL